MARTVVVGAGLAGLLVCEALRRESYPGEVVLIGKEPHLPYDRPPLSKEVLRGARSVDDIALRPAAYFDEHGIDLRLGVGAVGLDRAARVVATDDGAAVAYDHLVVATGLVPRHLPGVPSQSRVHVLRTLDDCTRLRAALTKGRRVIVVGAGFIGCEVAATLRVEGFDVVVVEPNQAPLLPVLGADVGALVARVHRDHGVDLRLGVGVRAVEQRPDSCRVELSDGTSVTGDAVVVGIGAVPVTDWLEGSGLEVADGVVCDAEGRTSDRRVWAAGDLACWASRRVEHWTRAGEQARIVARSIVGRRAPAAPTPEYVWSDQYGVRLQVLGHASADAEAHLLVDDGDTFLAGYVAAGRLCAVAGRGMARTMARYRQALAHEATLGELHALVDAARTAV